MRLEQSLVRFLLYANEWDVEGIICTLAKARDKENLNSERTGLGVVQRQLKAYGECYANLIKHDRRYPTMDYLWQRTVASYDGDVGVKLIVAAADSSDKRPIWICNWGTGHHGDESSFHLALNRAFKERGAAGYAKFKDRFRLSSADKFGDHTRREPPWTIWVDTFRPEIDARRWYHRFSPLTAKAGGFDLERDVLTGHGPLGALYPTNTTLPQKEGDTMTFLYLMPTGMNDPMQPTWGSWGARYRQMHLEGMEKCAARVTARHGLQVTAARHARFDFDQQSRQHGPNRHDRGSKAGTCAVTRASA